jgi:hypothetical protein
MSIQAELWFYDPDFRVVAELPLKPIVTFINKTKSPIRIVYLEMIIHDEKYIYGKMTTYMKEFPTTLEPGGKIVLQMSLWPYLEPQKELV